MTWDHHNNKTFTYMASSFDFVENLPWLNCFILHNQLNYFI